MLSSLFRCERNKEKRESDAILSFERAGWGERNESSDGWRERERERDNNAITETTINYVSERKRD
jgi:hypothetical protein